MTARTAIITGGNSGLGYEAAKAVAAASPDWHVVIASRDLTRSTEAARELAASSGNQHVEAMALDLGSLASVRRFASEFAGRQGPPLRALLCNAGLQIVTGMTHTADGFETTFAVNHLGHFLLANLLLERMVAPARIVFTSSDTHDPARRTGMPLPRWRDPHLLARPELDPEPDTDGQGQAGRRRYTTSKLCNVLCTYELARRIETSGLGTVTVNAFNPGFVGGTGLTRDYPGFVRVLARYVFPAFARMRSNAGRADSSGKALARLVLDPELEQATGRYYDRLEAVPSSEESYDQARAAELWRVSAELVQLTPEETVLAGSGQA
jgi:light-dependent protochlorophyllide reductase